jgi:hypothetical protein
MIQESSILPGPFSYLAGNCSQMRAQKRNRMFEAQVPDLSVCPSRIQFDRVEFTTEKGSRPARIAQSNLGFLIDSNPESAANYLSSFTKGRTECRFRLSI